MEGKYHKNLKMRIWNNIWLWVPIWLIMIVRKPLLMTMNILRESIAIKLMKFPQYIKIITRIRSNIILRIFLENISKDWFWSFGHTEVTRVWGIPCNICLFFLFHHNKDKKGIFTHMMHVIISTFAFNNNIYNLL